MSGESANKLFIILIAAVSASSLSGCSTALTCQNATCSGGAKTYQTCANLGGSVTYNYGGASCTCPPGNTTQCQTCTNDIAAFCGGGAGGSGGSGVGGDGGADGGATSCTYAVSGAFTLSGGSCTVMAAVSKNGGIGVVITSTDALEFGCTLSSQTAFQAGSYSLADCAPGAGADVMMGLGNAYVMCTTTQNCNDAKGNTVAPQGSFMMTISDPGPATSGILWQSPHGTLNLTLPAQLNGPAMGTALVDVTF